MKITNLKIINKTMSILTPEFKAMFIFHLLLLCYIALLFGKRNLDKKPIEENTVKELTDSFKKLGKKIAFWFIDALVLTLLFPTILDGIKIITIYLTN